MISTRYTPLTDIVGSHPLPKSRRNTIKFLLYGSKLFHTIYGLGGALIQEKRVGSHLKTATLFICPYPLPPRFKYCPCESIRCCNGQARLYTSWKFSRACSGSAMVRRWSKKQLVNKKGCLFIQIQSLQTQCAYVTIFFTNTSKKC